MTWEQRRAQILATIKSKKGLKTGILKKSLDEDRSTNEDEESQIQAIDDDIAKLQKKTPRKRMQALKVQKTLRKPIKV